MEEQKQRYSQESQHNYYDGKRRNFRDGNIDKKAVFWQKVKEARYEHRDRSKDQEILNGAGTKPNRRSKETHIDPNSTHGRAEDFRIRLQVRSKGSGEKGIRGIQSQRKGWTAEFE
ncbi:hypothetical protein OXYTRIMIC_395 [Oxytricha trifallax]|uniref:Uncharacterized protein n=1 Tax=Oxytricha trifallax TaxID=1172189 RepID=A0A073HYY8_9SPIT|nr:hypothetical protein OXYTRIMIC_395 [Oxytricha trifallax]